MAKQFTIAQFARHLERLALQTHSMQAGLTDMAGAIVEKQAKLEVGNPAMYDLQTGHFSAWKELQPATEAEKYRLGFPLDAPLERTGQLRDSISHVAHGTIVYIGSTDVVMKYQEFGTEHIPPRPVIGTALFIMTPDIMFMMRMALGAFLEGKSWQMKMAMSHTANPNFHVDSNFFKTAR